jgi:diguanylate cyclase (GGDEF)-like protein/PAS domain S-box-containing protein
MARTSLALLRDGPANQRESWFAVAGASTADLVLVLDRDGVVEHASDACSRVLGVASLLIQGHHLADQLHPEDEPVFALAMADWVADRAQDHVAEFRLRDDDGEWVGVEATAVNLLEHPIVQGIVVTARDLTHRRNVEATLDESQARIVRAARGANDGLWDWDLDSGEIHFSDRWRQMLGLRPDEPTGDVASWFDRIHPEDRGHFQALLTAHLDGHTDTLESDHRVLHADGTYRWMLCRGLAVRSGSGAAVRVAGSMIDISDRKLFDALTGLPNRSTFRDTLQQVIGRRPRGDEPKLYAVLMLDLDRFKVVNDSLGHGTGDRMLISVARRLETCVRARDTVARLGGDEFAILLDGLDADEDAERIAEHVKQLLARPIYVGSNEVYTTASVGIALSTKGYDHAGDMLRDADTAMHRAKRSGRDRTETFATAMHIETVNNFRMEVDLRRALRRKEFSVRYQPLVQLRDGRLAGFEALCRWEHPEHGFVSPMEFIPLAEEVGLIAPIDRWVLGEAARSARDWQLHHGQVPDLAICVNVSSKQFSRDDTVDEVIKVLEDTGLAPGNLKLEITESAIMDNPERAMEILEELRSMGVRLALDDFGTGYSSLSYLHRFPFDVIKIDRSFVSRMGIDGQDPEIVRTIIALAKSLEMDIVAEGVETALQMEMLRDLGARYGQGWHFARPLTPEDAERLVLSDERW